ncbi:MAG: septum formation protein Maf [Nanoarchaeota archaeon]|nr:septum formation protein Maf [Nanoarchaeota archaeon]MBU1051500.1 septum formation protein Maf [Nanoarchaeota archaeon]MBU1988690.1 septum formation protein Maf [Nanoarchaeota archaeon]
MKKIVLASSSERRERLLRLTGLDFVVDASDCPESLQQDLTPEQLAMELAYVKASAVAARHEDALVIGADTIVVLGERVLGKPKDEQEAVEVLMKLGGRWNRVVTGLCLVDRSRIIRDYCKTEVKFRPIGEEEARGYVAIGEPMDRAGAYAIQGGACWFVEEVKGDYQNVIGLPLRKLGRMLFDFRVEI